MNKKDGKINEIIYNMTAYNLGKNRLYPTFDELELIMDKVCKVEVATDYIRILPFYCNSKKRAQYEFEEDMFYIECRSILNEGDQAKHISDSYGKPIDELNGSDINLGKILYPLCEFSDVAKFQEAIKLYMLYLEKHIPIMMSKMIDRYHMTPEDIGFGYFCFEIHSA